MTDQDYLVMCESNGIVGISHIEVEWDAPHDDEPHVDLHQLPGDGAAGPHQGVRVLHHHHFSISRENVPWGQKFACFPTFCVCLNIEQGEHGPVTQAQNAAHSRPPASPLPLYVHHCGLI